MEDEQSENTQSVNTVEDVDFKEFKAEDSVEIPVVTVPELAKLQREARRKEQENLPKLKLMISTCYYQQTAFARYADSLIYTAKMLDEAGVEWVKHSLMGDSYIDRAKNSIVADFLESDCTDLLMIDSDMSFSPEAVARMLRHTEGVVGGFFPMKGAYNTFAGVLNPDADGNVPDLKKCKELWDGSCLFPAYLIPAAFLRIKRDVLERFADHYSELIYQDPMANQANPDRVYTAFFECMTHNYIRYGEDATFCRRLREMGEELWCDPNIDFGHTGMKTYEGNYHKSLLKPQDELDKIYAEREELANSVKAVRFTADEVSHEVT